MKIAKKYLRFINPVNIGEKKIFKLKKRLKKGIKNFRGADNNIGESFSDNQNINILNNYYGFFRGLFKFFLESIYPFKNIFVRQVKLTSMFKTELNLYKSNYYQNNKYAIDLSKKFILENTTKFGCEDFSIFNGNKISSYYLRIADIHLRIKDKVDFYSINTFLKLVVALVQIFTLS